MILRAKWVLPVSEPPIENGAVAIDGGLITAVGPAAQVQTAHPGEVRDLGEVVLCPGLINAHCHLDYTGMLNQVGFHGVFTDWIVQLVALKQGFTEDQYLAGITSGIDQLLQSGTTTVINIESFPSLIDRVPPPPLRVIWCPELIDFNKPGAAMQVVQEATSYIDSHSGAGREFGLSPHAPYTASAELHRLASRYTHSHHLLFTTHLAETVEEDDMFRRGNGPLYEYFRRARRDMGDCKRVGVVQLLREYGALTAECLIAHANCLTQLDVMLLAQNKTHVVHCPKSHKFFRRGTPVLEVLLHAGINICLGTDSLASNDTLSMFAEMQELSRAFPRWSAEQILPLATINAAKALNQSDRLGKIAVGACADLIAVPLDGALADPYEAVVYAEQPVNFMMSNGKAVSR